MSSFFCRMIVGTVVFQLLMVGVVGLKQSYAPSALLLPLPVVTGLFYFFILQHYIRPAANLSLKASHGLGDPASAFVQVSYLWCVAYAILYRQSLDRVQVGINEHEYILSKTNKIAPARRASLICSLWKKLLTECTNGRQKVILLSLC